MRSPFPGMDPYIEACGLWGDFHFSLVHCVVDELAKNLPDRYFARLGRRTYRVTVTGAAEDEHWFRSDVGLKRPGPALPLPDAEVVSLLPFVGAEFREPFVNVFVSEPGPRLITRVEVLCPANKRPGTTGWRRYLKTRQPLLRWKANLVEIDLLRGGTRMPMMDPWPASPYTLTVKRRERQRCRVWLAYFDRPLPQIPVPLERPDPDVTLDLQPLVEAVYARSKYHRSIDYARPLDPPLTEPQRQWLDQRLRDRSAAG